MKKGLFGALALAVAFIGCEAEDPATEISTPLQQDAVELKMVEVTLPASPNGKVGRISSDRGFDLEARVAEINDQLVAYGLQLEKMEYFSMDAAGQTVFFDDRGNKQLDSEFLPNDPRNALPGTDIAYAIDGTEAVTASGLNTIPIIDTAMSTWDGVKCSDGLGIYNAAVFPFDVGFVSSFFFGVGTGSGFFPGVILHAGNLPSSFFDLVAPGGGSGILGVTFTLTWIEDLDEDGKPDVALKEIYYNDAFNWQDAVAAGGGVDFETVCLHEVGHALGQAHFGKLFRTESNGKLHFAPRALMNAGYTGVNRVVEKTDKAGHCSNWGNWPNN